MSNSGNSTFDFKKWQGYGRDGMKAMEASGLQEEQDPTMQSIGDIGSYTSTGAAIGGPWGAVVGAGVGVIKSAFNYADARKARRAKRRAEQKRNRRINAMRQQELDFRKKELAAERENRRYNRMQDVNNQRLSAAQMQYNKLQNMMGNNSEFRRYMIQKGYA
jgi:hypothetical protein